EKRQHLTTRIRVSGIPTAKMLVPVGGAQHWRSNGFKVSEAVWPAWQTNLTRSFKLLGLHVPPPDAETVAWQARNNRTPPKVQAAGEGELYLDAYLQRSVVARLSAEPPDYSAHIVMAQLQPELIFEAPLRPGEKARGSDHTARIDQVILTPGRYNVSSRAMVVVTRPITSWFLVREFARADGWLNHFQSLVSFQAFHRARGEFASVREDKSRTIVINGVGVTWYTFDVAPGWVYRSGQWVQRPEWSEGVSLALVRMNDEAIFARDVRADRVPIEKDRAPGAENQ
ncbi:MAG TPA: hypothetical protein VM029_20335, partial [Opitutaceae bacterium]|nr:hypothetical protein [Opitutaceae bacterium]